MLIDVKGLGLLQPTLTTNANLLLLICSTLSGYSVTRLLVGFPLKRSFINSVQGRCSFPFPVYRSRVGQTAAATEVRCQETRFIVSLQNERLGSDSRRVQENKR